MAARAGAQLVIDALLEAGVETVFGYPGGAIMPLYDALLDSPIEHVLTRHEQAAIHAADGYARSSGRLGVCVATSGPGATNLVTGICTAMMDSTPLLCLTGQVATPLIGTDGFQEADTLGIVAVITKHSYLVRSADELPSVIQEAIYLAQTGRPGPVLVDLPKDVLLARTDAVAPPQVHVPGYVAKPAVDHTAVKRAHELLKSSERPVCMVGGGCASADATALLRQWCEAIQIPVITTLMGIGAADPDYAGWLGMPGMHGLRRANRAITACDVIVAMGMRFDDRVTGKIEAFAPHARIVHVDIDVAEIGKIIPVDIAVHGDLATVLETWLDLLVTEDCPSFSAWQREAMDVGDGLTAPADGAPGTVPSTILLDALLKMIGPNCFVTTDVGQHQMWVAQRIRPANPRHFITSGGAGTMGFGLPSAVGAAFANPHERIVAIVGDGGFQMTMAELATIRRCNVPVKIMVMDNKYLGMVRQWQELFFAHRYSGVDMSDNPDFAELARVYGLAAFKLECSKDMESVLKEWWTCDGPALLHAVCRAEENVFPMVPAGAGLAEMVESVQ